MRLSSIQKETLFILYAFEDRGSTGAIPAMAILKIINRVKPQAIHATNFRASCHKLVDHGMLQMSRSESLKLRFKLTEQSRPKAKSIYDERTAE